MKCGKHTKPPNGVRLMPWRTYASMPLGPEYRVIFSDDPFKQFIVATIFQNSNGKFKAILRLNSEFSMAGDTISKSFLTREIAISWADKILKNYGFILLDEKIAVMI